METELWSYLLPYSTYVHRFPPPLTHLEGLPELLGHEAVEDEVDGGVDERHGVHDVAQRAVAVLEELVAVDGGQQAQDALPREGEYSLIRLEFLGRRTHFRFVECNARIKQGHPTGEAIDSKNYTTQLVLQPVVLFSPEYFV